MKLKIQIFEDVISRLFLKRNATNDTRTLRILSFNFILFFHLKILFRTRQYYRPEDDFKETDALNILFI